MLGGILVPGAVIPETCHSFRDMSHLSFLSPLSLFKLKLGVSPLQLHRFGK